MIALVPLAVVLPLAGGFLSALIPGRMRRLADALAVLVTGAVLVLSFNLLFERGDYRVGGWWPGVGILMVLDGLSAFMLVVVAAISFIVVVYSVRYMDSYTARNKYYTLFLLMQMGMNGAIITGDMFNFYVFLEIASISSYALVAFGCEKDELEASFKYAVLGSVAGSLFLLGLAILYAQTGAVNMAHLATKLSAGPLSPGIFLAAALMMAGLGVKSALIPFHAWLPDAHPSAPAPISAMLSGVLIKALGIYMLSRMIFNVFGGASPLPETLSILGMLSMIIGGLLGPMQKDLKRLLAYSSISQMGYIALSIGLGTPLGFAAGLFHLANHAVFKSLLFLGAGAIQKQAGTRELPRMGGLAGKMPVTAASFFVGAMSISGVPPFNGFFSKLLIVLACVEAQRYGLATVAVLLSMVTLAYFLKVQREAFMGDDGGRWDKVKEAPFSMVAAMILLAVLCLGLSGLAIPGMPRKVLDEAAWALSEGSNYKRHLGRKPAGSLTAEKAPVNEGLVQE